MAQHDRRSSARPRHLATPRRALRHARNAQHLRPRHQRVPSRNRIGLLLACVMAVIGGLVAIPDATATTVTSRFNSDADAFVSQAEPNANFGTSPTLRTNDSRRTQRSYLRFDVSQLPGTVVVARLRLFADRRDRVGYAVRSVAGSDWTENRVT
jgi:hypothetical protein